MAQYAPNPREMLYQQLCSGDRQEPRPCQDVDPARVTHHSRYPDVASGDTERFQRDQTEHGPHLWEKLVGRRVFSTGFLRYYAANLRGIIGSGEEAIPF